MSARQMFSALGLYLLTGLLAAYTAGPAWFVAHTAGAQALTLRGTAEFGPVVGAGGTGPFVLTLGAESPTGAVVFTRADGTRPGPGVYPVSEGAAAGVRALVVTGPPTRPTGAFRARAGTLTITRSSGDVIEGRFELETVGFEAADPGNEDRGLVVRGAFNAHPGLAARYTFGA
jgi:hypothetical protein